LERWSRADEEAVQFAMRATSIEDLSFRLVDQLSGGQRQRVWIAMVLAQQTPLLLLDEPTTFLDITYQYDVLELCRDLNEQHERTVVAVLHDLNQAARFATNLVVMHEGQVRAEGDPREVLTRETVREVYGLDCQVIPDPVSGAPLVIPLERGRSVRSAV
jgi:iron complex transport system ATP-binding protein